MFSFKILLIYLCFTTINANESITNTTMMDASPPRMVEQPPNDEILFKLPSPDEEFRSVYLRCEAEGFPEPTYRWIKNGAPFDWESQSPRITQQPGRGSLIISEPRSEDAGQYQCFAENEHGTSMSNSVHLRKAEFHRFKPLKPQVLSAQEGKPFMISCDVPYGYPKPNIFWVKTDQKGGLFTLNDPRITVDPEGNLWFSNVTLSDASTDFEYTCVATAFFSNEYKMGNKVILNVGDLGLSFVEYHFSIVRQYVSPPTMIGVVGKTIELFCIYGGSPRPRVEWTKNGNAVVYTDRVLDNNFGKSLMIKDLAFNDSGTYTCDVSNGAGKKDQYTITVEIQSKPYFVQKPLTKVVAEGDEVELECVAKGVPMPESYWVYNGKTLDLSNKDSRKVITNKRIVIQQVELQDAGNYGCNISNIHGYEYNEAIVQVQTMPPQPISLMKNQIVTLGSNITINCPVSGAPKPNIQWNFQNYPLNHDRVTITDEFSLEIINFQHLDQGNYTCTATNKYGTYSATAEILVTGTKIIEGPKRHDVKVGEWVNFRCRAVSLENRHVTVSWLKNNNEIQFGTDERVIQAMDGSLTIINTSQSDAGVYTCLAKSDVDEARATALLRIFKGGCHTDDD